MNVKTHEQFHVLEPLDAHNMIAGDVRISILASKTAFTVTVKEARNLAAKDSNGLSDPFARLQLGNNKKKSSTQKKTLNPKWDESFDFATDADQEWLRITLWDWDLVGSSEFMGQAMIQLPNLNNFDELNEFNNRYQDVWLVLSSHDLGVEKEGDDKAKKVKSPQLLRPTGKLTRKVSDLVRTSAKVDPETQTLGSLRIKIKYNEQMLLPLESYTPLLNELKSNLNISSYLEDVCPEKEYVGRNLVNIYFADSYEAGVAYLDRVTHCEIESMKTPDVIFRGNTLATKSLDAFMRLVGTDYLTTTLQPVIQEVIKSTKSCEVDPMKIEKGENAEKNMENLKQIITLFIDAILDSKNNMPKIFKVVFANLGKRVQEKWPDAAAKNSKYPAVAGFIFLRFFNPAILGPKLFHLVDKFLDEETSRKLTLVSKTMQNLANLVNFGEKEKFMIPLNSLLEQRQAKMMEFLDFASTSTDKVATGYVRADLQKELGIASKYLTQYLPAMKEGKKPGLEKLEGVLKNVEAELAKK